MAGEPSNATLWEDADVYVSDSRDDLTFDDDGNFTGDEGTCLVGLLDGETGINHTREMESNDRYAYGGILVRTIDRNFKHGFSMTLLEDNDVTRSIVWPGSTATQVKVARPAMKYVALRQQEGGRVRTRVSVRKVRLAVDGEIPENETDITNYPVAATLYPDSDKTLWDQRTVGDVELETASASVSTARVGSFTTSDSDSGA